MKLDGTYLNYNTSNHFIKHTTSHEKFLFNISPIYQQIKNKGIPLYPVLIHAIFTCVNQSPFLRMHLDETGEPGIWEHMDPSFTIFQEVDKQFSLLSTEYVPDFYDFYHLYRESIKEYLKDPMRFSSIRLPDNSFCICSLPREIYSYYSNIFSLDPHFLKPIFRVGRVSYHKGSYFLHLEFQLHQIMYTAFHKAQFAQLMNEYVQSATNWF